MQRLFIVLEWFNENHTAEELIAYIFVLFASTALGATQVLTMTHAGFIFFIGLALCFNFYVVALIQRWYVKKTQKKMEDFDYSKIIEDDFKEED